MAEIIARPMRKQLSLAASVAVLLASACDARPRAAPSPAPPSTPPQAVTYAVGKTTKVDVAGDRPAVVTHAPPDRDAYVVYLHGMCKTPEDMNEWASLAQAHGTIVAVRGDTECSEGGTMWTKDVASIHARIAAAVQAVASVRGAPFREPGILVGYSQGAYRAEALAAAYPETYRRLVLVAGPTQPAVTNLGNAEAVVTIAGDRDRQDLMKGGADDLRDAGKAARYLVLPGAAHGEYGAEGSRVMGEAFRFVEGPAVTTL